MRHLIFGAVRPMSDVTDHDARPIVEERVVLKPPKKKPAENNRLLTGHLRHIGPKIYITK